MIRKIFNKHSFVQQQKINVGGLGKTIKSKITIRNKLSMIETKKYYLKYFLSNGQNWYSYTNDVKEF